MTAQDSGGGVPLEVLLEHRAWVRALARSLVSDSHRADDVEQDTWRMAIERPPRDDRKLRLAGYDLIDGSGRALEIVVHPVPVR